MKTLTHRLLFAIAFLATASVIEAQKPCGYIGLRTVYKLERCVDSLKARVDSITKYDNQIRLAIHDIYGKLPPNGRTTQEYVNSAVAAGGGSVVTPTTGVGNRVDGNLIVTGKVCIGTTACLPSKGNLQVSGVIDAEVNLISNTGGNADQEGPARHVSTISLAGDRGLRLIHNQWHHEDGRTMWEEPTFARSILGFDSQGTLSFSQDYDGVIDPSQVWVFRIDRDNNRGMFTNMKPGMKMCLGWSNATNAYDNLWCPPSGNTAAPRSRGFTPPPNKP